MPTQKPELIDVDPSTLVIGTNVRRDPHAEMLVSSLKSNGMLHPIRARRVDGDLEVIDGQRRTLAAIQAGLASVPVLVVDASDTGRVFEQYVSNEHREALTDAERVGTVKQLALMGLAAGTIAKRTGLTKTVVEQATAISDTALELAPHGSLEDLAALASIEGQPEHEEAASRLAGGDSQYFRAIVTQTQRRLAAEAETARIREQHPGLVILDTAPSYGDKQYLDLTGYEAPRLEREDGTPVPSFRAGYNQPAPSLDEAITHIGPALAVHVSARSGYGDSLTETRFYVDAKQLKAAGLRKAKAASATPEKTPEEKQAEQIEREQVKAWTETADDRKTFLARLLQEKQPPTGWEALVTAEVFGSGIHLRYSEVKLQAVRQMLALDQLDLEADEDSDAQQLLLQEIQKRPDRLAFALTAAALANIEEGDCRLPAGHYYSKPFTSHGHLGNSTPAYLDQLEKWGYDATAERQIIAEVTA